MIYITALVLVCVMQNLLPSSAQGIVGMPKGCKGDYPNAGRYKFGHGSGIIMQLCDPSCHISPSTEDALMGSGQVFTTDKDDIIFLWNVTSPWFGIAPNFRVRSLCTEVRNVERVTVLYSKDLPTAILQTVDIDDPTLWTKVCASLPNFTADDVSLGFEQAGSRDMKIKDTVLKYCLKPITGPK